MQDRKPLPGKFVWFELVTNDVKKAKDFYREVLAWKSSPYPMGAETYEMILAGETQDSMVGGYVPAKGEAAHWIAYVSVEDVDAAAKAAEKNGGKIVVPPTDIPKVGRKAVIADPQGAVLALHGCEHGDPPDVSEVPPGRFLWNELQTPDPKKAVAFYEKVVGFTHKEMDMGRGETYTVLSKGGVDRGGITHHMLPGSKPQWIPYVTVEDPDAILARAKKAGGSIPMPAEEIPGVGRFGILKDPTGAVLAVMKPKPSEEMKRTHAEAHAVGTAS